MGEIETPQFSLPFRLDGRQEVVVVEQDEPDEVGDCIEVQMRTPLGSIEEAPEFGMVDPTFEEDVNLAAMQTAIVDQDGRADAIFEEDPELLDRYVRNINVSARIRTEA